MADGIDPDIPVRPHVMPGATSRDDWGYDRVGIAAAVDVCFLMLGESRESIETAVGWYVDAGAHSVTLYNFGHIYDRQDIRENLFTQFNEAVARAPPVARTGRCCDDY